MHSALLVINPKTDQEWDELEAYAKRKSAHFEGAVRLAKNVWLIDLHKSVGLLGLLVGKAEAAGIPYGVLPLDSEPVWLPQGFSPESV